MLIIAKYAISKIRQMEGPPVLWTLAYLPIPVLMFAFHSPFAGVLFALPIVFWIANDLL